MTRKQKNVTTRPENKKRLHIYLTGLVKEFHLEMRDTYPQKTDSALIGMLQRAGSPAQKALDAIDTAMQIYRVDLPEDVAEGLLMAVMRARRAVAGLEDHRTLQTVLQLKDRGDDEIVDEVMRA